MEGKNIIFGGGGEFGAKNLDPCSDLGDVLGWICALEYAVWVHCARWTLLGELYWAGYVS